MSPSEWKTEHGFTIRMESVRMLVGSKVLFRVYKPKMKRTERPEGFDTLAEAIGRANDMARGMCRS